jgi:hypothetical protein
MWLVLVVVVCIAGGAFITTARADGGVPATPTFPPLPTLTPTPIPLFFPTITPPVEPYPSVEQSLPMLFATQAVVTPTPAAPATRFSGLICWPFAVGLLLVAVLVSSFFIRRG